MIAVTLGAAAELREVEELLLAEHDCDSGELESLFLTKKGSALRRSRRSAASGDTGAGAGKAPGRAGAEMLLPLPDNAVDAVMRRYGRPLASPISDAVERLGLPSGASLRRFRYLARFDVIAKDYLLYEAGDGEPLAALATSVAAALRYLAEAKDAD